MRLAPITGLFGSNSSGKTSLIQLLLLMKQTAESTDRAQVLNFGDERSYTSLGTFGDVVSEHDRNSLLDWSVSWTTEKELDIADPEHPGQTLFAGRDFRLAASVRETSRERLVVESLTYELNGHKFRMRRKADARNRYELRAEAGGFRFKRPVGRPWDLPAPVKFYGFPDQVKARFQNAGFLGDLQLAFEDLMAGIYYLGPLREYPQRQYIWAGGQPEDVGIRGERVVDALLASRAREITISRGKGRKRLLLEEYVAVWLQELGLIQQFAVETLAEGSNLYQIRVRKTARSPEVLITDVGFGVSQILPVLVLCFYVPPHSIIVLEQPEIHLHPSVQAGLADVIVDAVRKRHVQVIVESHSEYLLQRLQRRIAEEEISPGETALYFCDTVGGSSTLLPLEVDIFGNITNWPKDFFGDSFGEMAAMTEAAAKRKQQRTA